MPFIKKAETPAVATAIAAPAESQEAKAAPVRRKLAATPTPAAKVGRDFDAEARGKTRCALEEAWAQSPLLPMLIKDPANREELHALLDDIVTARMKRVFPNG